MDFACANCGKIYPVEDEMAGKRVKCPSCNAVVDVPRGVEVAAPILQELSNSEQRSAPASNAWAIASLTCGITGILTSFFVVGIFPAICAIVFYAIQRKHGKSGMVTVGFVLGIVAVPLSTFVGGFLGLIGALMSRPALVTASEEAHKIECREKRPERAYRKIHELDEFPSMDTFANSTQAQQKHGSTQ